jgi:hypothetical protein
MEKVPVATGNPIYLGRKLSCILIVNHVGIGKAMPTHEKYYLE